jgi:endonuclease/exonuclease/phosphatase family metal-dependent hydrolase
LAGLPSGDVNIINLYVSTEAVARLELWEELIRVLPRDCRSILVGDFNFVEHR